MYCENEFLDETTGCPSYSAAQTEDVGKTSTDAVRTSAVPGFVCSLIGIFTLPFVHGIIGLILGFMGYAMINDALRGNCDSKGLAKAGKIIGIVDMGLCGVMLLLKILGVGTV